MIRTV